MSFDQQLRTAFDSLADLVRDDMKRRLAGLSDELGDAFETERAAVVAQATAAAEAGAAAAIAAAEARGAREGIETGRQTGREEGFREGRTDGLEEGKQAGLLEGREEGWRSGHDEGVKDGHAQSFAEGEQAGRAQAIAEGEKSGRAQGFAEGEKSGRAQGFTEGEKSGRAQGFTEGEQAGRAQGLAEGEQAGRAAATAEARHQVPESALSDQKAAELAANERLIDAVRAIDRAKSLTEILDTLVSSAGAEARRAAVLLVRGGQLRGWRFIGFGQPLDEKNDVEVAASDAGVIAEAARTGAAVSADSAAANAAPSFAKLPPGREVFAVPVSMGGQIVAVLYADQGAQDTAGGSARLAWPSIVELLARHAARCLEAITAFRAAKVLTERPDVPGAKAAQDGAAEALQKVEAGDKEDPKEAARRYARLLVSEIKLYHEPAVIAGRKEGDLMTRLGGEIARARVLYEQRVPAAVRLDHDYFHDELVKTLAGGDPKLIEVKN